MTQQEKLEAILKDLVGTSLSTYTLGAENGTLKDHHDKAVSAITALIQEARAQGEIDHMETLDGQVVMPEKVLKIKMVRTRIDELRKASAEGRCGCHVCDYIGDRLQQLSGGSNNDMR